jgi:hypothetical protein
MTLDPLAEIGLLLYPEVDSARVNGLTDLLAVFRGYQDRELISMAISARCPVPLLDH